MKKQMGLFLFLFSQVVCAERFSSTIHSVDFGRAAQDHLVRFDNGRVIFLRNKELNLMKSLILSKEKREMIEVKTDSRNRLVAAQTIPSEEDSSDEQSELIHESADPYRPSVIRNYNSALKIFRLMRRRYTKAGECFNRAHIWGYEEFQRSKLKSMKIFMFFTERYIRRYNYHWWFHVTPMVYVGNVNTPRTLDRRYTSGPRQTKAWSNIFIKSKRTCRIVKKYDDFWLNQQREDCYHIYSSMYYVIPRDLEKRDLTGIEKTEFIEKEIRRAYQNGFNM